jgi:transcriptional regulator with XRE-family HTH domain
MTTGQIKGALHDLGITQKAIAAQIGKSENAVSKVVRMEMVSDPIMRAIAGRLGREPWDVFDYYRRRPRRKTSKTLTPFERVESGRRRKAA